MGLDDIRAIYSGAPSFPGLKMESGISEFADDLYGSLEKSTFSVCLTGYHSSVFKPSAQTPAPSSSPTLYKG